MRIVSLCPSLTELVCDLGAGADLVGRTRFCIHPAEQVANIERVGGTKNPKLERIVALAPDVVLMNEEENRREDADVLRNAGLRIHASLPKSAEETAQMIEDIAAEIGRRDEGVRMAVELRTKIAAVKSTAAQRLPVRYAYLIWRDPWMTVSNDTFVSGLLRDAGGENVFGESAMRYPEFVISDLVRRNPTRVLLATEPFPFSSAHQSDLARELGWPHDRIQLVDGELLSWHGSRTLRGIEYAAQVLTSEPA